MPPPREGAPKSAPKSAPKGKSAGKSAGPSKRKSAGPHVQFAKTSFEVVGWTSCPHFHAAVKILRDHNAEFSVQDKADPAAFQASLVRRGSPLSAAGEAWTTSPAVWRIVADAKGIEHRFFIGGHASLKNLFAAPWTTSSPGAS